MTNRTPITQKNNATVKDNTDSATNTTNNCPGPKLQLRASFQCRHTKEPAVEQTEPSNSSAESSEKPVGQGDEVLTDMLRYFFQHCFNITRFSGNN
jgi:hypothetical protein